MHTILGANGVIARELSQALAAHTSAIRQVSRNPRKVNPTDETCVADLLDAQATANAVAGSKVVIWWPVCNTTRLSGRRSGRA